MHIKWQFGVAPEQAYPTPSSWQQFYLNSLLSQKEGSSMQDVRSVRGVVVCIGGVVVGFHHLQPCSQCGF